MMHDQTRSSTAYMYMNILRQYTHNIAYEPSLRSSVICWWTFPDIVYAFHRIQVYASDYLCTCIVIVIESVIDNFIP